MPHATVSAIFTKAVLAKACAAVMVTGVAGVAYETIPERGNEVSIEAVSVYYDETGSAVLAFHDEEAPQETDTEQNTGDSGDDDSGDDAKDSASAPADASRGDKEDEKTPVTAADTVAGDPVAGDTVAPEIEILYPADGSHHETKVVVFEGKTEAGAQVHAGRFAASVDAKGNWRIELILSPGANGAVISATDAAGNVGYDKVTVWLDVPKEDKPAPEDDGTEGIGEVAFDAKQKYGSCDAENPYEKFWGLAPPNSFVNVTSPYGSGVTEVNKHGKWEITVFFPDAPRDKHFVIKVTGANGTESFDYVAKTPYVEPIKQEQPLEPKDPLEDVQPEPIGALS